MVVEAPRVEVLLAMQLSSESLLKDLDAPFIRHSFELPLHLDLFTELFDEHPLVMEIYIKFKHVVPCQLLDVFFVLFNLVVDPLDFRPSPPVQSLPELLNLVD